MRTSRPKEILDWAVATFGGMAIDRTERAMRFLEEAIELAQSEDISQIEIARIICRVFPRPPGNAAVEIGQCMVTLECLAENIGVSADEECDREFARVKTISNLKWRQRQNAKEVDLDDCGPMVLDALFWIKDKVDSTLT